MVGLLEGCGVVPIEQQILADHAGLMVGHMLELILRADVAERENASRGGALVFVDRDATVAHLDTRQLGVEQVAVGDPARRHQHHVSLQRRTVVHRQGDAVTVLARTDHVAVVVNFPFLRCDVGEPLAHGVVAVP